MTCGVALGVFPAVRHSAGRLLQDVATDPASSQTLAIPSIGAAESLTRLTGKGGACAIACDASFGRALARDLARLQDEGAGGMASVLQQRVPALT